MSRAEPSLSRRTALLAATGSTAATLAGCGAGRPAPTEGDTSGRVSDRSSEPDTRLVRQAFERELQVQQELRQAAPRHPRLRSELQRLVARHREHLDLLEDAFDPDETFVTVTAEDPGLAPHERAAALARSERRLADGHARAALASHSGPFARVLAGMAAAAEQQAHVLDGLALTGPDRG